MYSEESVCSHMVTCALYRPLHFSCLKDIKYIFIYLKLFTKA